MRLNPFVYLSETDLLFYSLILLCLIIPVDWAQIVGYVVGSVELENSISSEYLSSVLFVLLVVLVSALTFRVYRRSPKRIAAESQMKTLQETKFPQQYHSIQRLYADYPHTFEEPALMYNLDLGASAFTFGAGKNQSIQMSSGLLLTDEPQTFDSILQHEMGHLENKDVGKASLAISAVSVMKVLLPAILVAVVLEDLYLKTGLFYYGTISGYDPNYILSQMQWGRSLSWFGILALIFVIFGVLIFALRNQIVRLREFYADARVVEWKKASTDLENTLQKQSALSSRFESLRRFHPSSEERIQMLRDNSKLFVPSLWIAFSAGLLYSFLAQEIPSLWASLFMPQTIVRVTPEYNLVAAISVVLFFGITAFAISSEIHKFILRETFANNVRYFSRAALLNIVKVAIVFSLGINFGSVVLGLQGIGGYFDQLDVWAMQILSIFSTPWLVQAVHFFLALAFLWFLGSMLVRRSFSRKDARRNFFFATILTSVLYLITDPKFAGINDAVWVSSVLAFVGATYLVIRARDGRLRCPSCGRKVRIASDASLVCPGCGNKLYSWAVYPS